jgi:hypothetical protein
MSGIPNIFMVQGLINFKRYMINKDIPSKIDEENDGRH